MPEVVRLVAGELSDADLQHLFGQCYWYPGAPAMRERLAAVELYGYRLDRLQGLVGLERHGDQAILAPWTPAVAAGAPDVDAVALGLLEAAKATCTGLLSVLRDQEGSRARAQARWLRDAGFGEVTVRLAMARELANLASIPERAGLTWETVGDPELLSWLAEACYAGGLDPIAATLGAEGWVRRLRQLKQGSMGSYLTGLSELLRVEDRPAGFFLGTERGPGKRFPEGWVYLADIGVTADARGQGLGTTLLGRFLTRTWQEGYVGVWLLVDDMNAPARALFRAFGFRVLEVITRGRWPHESP